MTKIETDMCHLGEKRVENRGAVVPPIYQNSLFTFDRLEDIENAFRNKKSSFIYSRTQNPSVRCLEEKLARLAEAEASKCFASGMGAISAGILHFLKAGDHVIAEQNIYGPTKLFLTEYLQQKMDIEVSFIDARILENFEKNCRPNTKLVYVESPTSVVFDVLPLRQIAEWCQSKRITSFIDNTWATPLFQKPLKLGFDLEAHSCSKYLGGHSDVVAGCLMGSQAIIEAIAAREHEWIGAKMAPHEAWLVNRSMRTLSMRMNQHAHSASQITAWLEQQDAVDSVWYPGLKSHLGHELAKQQMTGFTGLFTFRLNTERFEDVAKFVEKLQLFSIGVSWGGHESLVFAPAIAYRIEQNPDQFKKMGIHVGDIRLSIGLEDSQDLINDLKQALNGT